VGLAGLVEQAAAFVSNSTGPMHLAAALGTPVVAFYPPIRPCRPERWGPYGQRARVLMSQQEECDRCPGADGTACACMRAIPVDTALARVTEAAAERLSAGDARGTP
jgi:ADP-heptose:LPS heptosyltransferase